MLVGLYDGAVDRSIVEIMSLASRSRGGQPLVTHYRPAGGERTELSVTSFANWVDKTANLLEDIGVDGESVVSLPVLVERPAHWMSLIWPFALWQRGLCARVTAREQATAADLAVIGPDHPQPVSWQTIACSLHPWGLPLVDLGSDVLDFSTEALAQPDAHVRVPTTVDAKAWIDDENQFNFGELTSLAPIDSRVASVPKDAWDSVSALIRVILGGGSLVLVEGTADQATGIAATERARLLA